MTLMSRSTARYERSPLLHAATCLTPIEKCEGGGAQEPSEVGGAPVTSRARQQQAEIKASPAAKTPATARKQGGGASPLKLYLGQILLAAANLSSAAHTNHSGGSSRRQHQSLMGLTGGEVGGWGFHLLGLMHARHKGALREVTEDLKLQEAHFT